MSGWIEYDISHENIVIQQGNFFVSVFWDFPIEEEGGVNLGNDDNSPHDRTYWKWLESDWTLITDAYPWYGNAMIRAVVTDSSTLPYGKATYDFTTQILHIPCLALDGFGEYTVDLGPPFNIISVGDEY